MRQDPYASSVFQGWDQPQVSYPEMPPPSEEESTEIIDYWSVEAYRQGWHGDWGKHTAQQAINAGKCREKGTKYTKMDQCW